MNDEILCVQTLDINNPSRIDSTFTAYEYNSNETIKRQKQTYSNRKDSIVFNLVDIKGDTLNYSKREFYYRPNAGNIDTYSYNISLVFNSVNQVIYKREVDIQKATTEITEYGYEYSHYRSGLTKKMYGIIGETKFKLADYQYD